MCLCYLPCHQIFSNVHISVDMAFECTNRRCSSYQDFSQMEGSSESVHLLHTPPYRDTSGYSPDRANQLKGGRSWPHPKATGKTWSMRRSSSAEWIEDDSHAFLPILATPPTSSRPMTPRGHLCSRPHTPVGRVDIQPCEESPAMFHTSSERWHPPRASVTFTPHSNTRKTAAKVSLISRLPPLPPNRATPSSPAPHYLRRHHSPFSLAKYNMFTERDTEPIRILENNVDGLLTRLCGCDKLLQSLTAEQSQLQEDDTQAALEMSRMQLDEWKHPDAQVSQKTLLQEGLVTIRAQLCDLFMVMENVWSQYETIESELSILYSHLQHICHFAMPQEQSRAQRQLWMIDDILCGLKANRNHFRLIFGLDQHADQEIAGLDVQAGPQQCLVRPPLPQDLQEANHIRELHCWAEPYYEVVNNIIPGCEQGGTQTGCGSPERNGMKNDWMEQTEGEAEPVPVRVARVVTATLPSTLMPRRISVETQPPEETLMPLAYRTLNQPTRLMAHSAQCNAERFYGEGCIETPLQTSVTHHDSVMAVEDLHCEVSAEAIGPLGQNGSIIRGSRKERCEMTSEPGLTPGQKEATVRQEEQNPYSFTKSGSRPVGPGSCLQKGLTCLDLANEATGSAMLMNGSMFCTDVLDAVPGETVTNGQLSLGAEETCHDVGAGTNCSGQDSDFTIFHNGKDTYQSKTSLMVANKKTEWFLSTNQRHGFIPVSVPGNDLVSSSYSCSLLTANTNQSNESVCLTGDEMNGDIEEPYNTDCKDNGIPDMEQQGSDNQVASKTSHNMSCSSDLLNLYEEIRHAVFYPGDVSRLECGGSPISIQDAEPGERSPEEQLKEHPALQQSITEIQCDDMGSRESSHHKCGCPIYSTILKNGAANHCSPFSHGRVTVVSTSF
ncbi:pleckstrin homology domain-containing family A member 4 isoform X3 [Denticeps clupeoides]|uniref:pleckstrin homology domain-containing family A member 4 isoform X3 n=1 Tax=Denticeps clupeoides TaxID=299321 RepID=UPI0010A55DF7|nr:uncharacterized protein LOC114784244 isoform X3 [Denticeps clupeoides]